MRLGVSEARLGSVDGSLVKEDEGKSNRTSSESKLLLVDFRFDGFSDFKSPFCWLVVSALSCSSQQREMPSENVSDDANGAMERSKLPIASSISMERMVGKLLPESAHLIDASTTRDEESIREGPRLENGQLTLFRYDYRDSRC